MSSADPGAQPPDSVAQPPVGRRRLHTRSIVVEVYARDDGLLDLEARLTDVKDHDLPLPSGLRPAGEAIHDMHLSVAVDRDFNVIAAGARSSTVPYVGSCETGSAYGALKGLNLLDKFRKAVMQVIGGTRGCTHLSELAGILPTVAVQAAAGMRRVDPDQQPFQLDRCHALVTDGEAVRRFYPRWYRGGRPVADPADGVVADPAGGAVADPAAAAAVNPAGKTAHLAA